MISGLRAIPVVTDDRYMKNRYKWFKDTDSLLDVCPREIMAQLIGINASLEISAHNHLCIVAAKYSAAHFHIGDHACGWGNYAFCEILGLL